MIKFEPDGTVKEFTIILSQRNYHHLGPIRNIEHQSVVYNRLMNGANEISFNVYKRDDEYEEPLWEDIVDFKYVYVKELDEYFEITVSLYDSSANYKVCTGTSVCEAELSQTKIFGLEINSDVDILRDDYKITRFYDPDDKEASLLHRALYKVPHYTIKHVDEELWDLQRTFSANDVDVYSFLTSSVAEAFNCIFIFDSKNKYIYVYDLKSYCYTCGHRGEFTHVCPECGENDYVKIKRPYGKDTMIYFDTENLSEQIELNTNTDNIKNCFRLEAGDDLMTASVINCNPNGSQYLYYFSDEMKKEMSQGLVSRLEQYDELLDSKRQQHKDLISNVYDYYNQIAYYRSEMMPETSIGSAEISSNKAADEGKNLTVYNLSPTAITSLTRATSIATIDSAIKNYSKVFVHSGYFKIEVNGQSFSFIGEHPDGHNYGTWSGTITVTNYSNQEDVYTTPVLNIDINDNYELFMKEKVLKQISIDEDDYGIFDISSLMKLDNQLYAIEIQKYSVNRLQSFYDSIENVLNILIEADQAQVEADLYDKFYLPYYEKLEITQNRINYLNRVIEEITNQKDSALDDIDAMQKALNFEEFLGDYYNEFLVFRREDTYSNSNYISDNLSDEEILENARNFINVASDELVKAATPVHTISTTLGNLLMLDEFKSIREDFDVGIYIHAGIDEKIYELRLIRFSINFGNTQTIDVEFSDVTKTKGAAEEMASILQQASSMASSYNAYISQATTADKNARIVRDWVKRGMGLTATKIVNNTNTQNVTYDEHGILVRSYDDIEDVYSKEQMKLINSTIAITDDNWKTVKSALGKYIYIDPLTGDEKIAYGLLAETIVGNLILGNQLGIYSSDSTKSLEFSNNGFVINAIDNGTGRYEKIFDIQKDGQSQMYIDSSGNVVIRTPQMEKIDTLADGEYVVKVETYYAVTSSDKVKPDINTWSLEYPTGDFIWQKTVTTYADGSVKESNPACITGSNGYTINILPPSIVLKKGDYKTVKVQIEMTRGQTKREDFKINRLIDSNGEDSPVLLGLRDGYFNIVYAATEKQPISGYIQVELVIDNLIFNQQVGYSFANDGESSIRVEVRSQNGNIFYNNNVSSVLTCHVFDGRKEITDELDDTKFSWQKINPDTKIIDEEWENHNAHTKSIYIENKDILKRAVINCFVDV